MKPKKANPDRSRNTDFSMIDSIFSQPLLLEWLLRSVAISVLAMAGLRFLARCSSSARCRFLLVVMGILLVLPLVMPFARWQVVLPFLGNSAAGNAGSHSVLDLLPLVLGVWLVGFVVWIVVLVVGMWRLNRVVATGSCLEKDSKWSGLLDECCEEIGCRSRPRLVATESRSMPCAVGLLRPTVILPESASEWSETRCRMVLLHELGHLVRGDLWLQWVSLIVRAVYWFNPAVWFLHRSLLAHREEACDALVLATGAGPLEYARHLLEIASSHRSASTLSPALAMSGKCSQPGQLELRIVQLLGSRSQRPGRLAQWLGGIAATGFAALVLGTALVAPVFTSGQEVSNAVWTEEEVDLRWGAQAFPGE